MVTLVVRMTVVVAAGVQDALGIDKFARVVVFAWRHEDGFARYVQERDRTNGVYA